VTESLSISPTICLNMIVRNEAHIVDEVLDATAPYISSWVIVDTGSTDGTQDLIKMHMARLGIPGELHERPWVDFGHNRTEALNLAQGHGDYIWVMDADDTIAGTPDFTGLTADMYLMHVQVDDAADATFWRPQLFRTGLPIRYEGAVHEQPACSITPTVGRIEGDYRLVFRQLGGRDREQDAELLRAAIERDPMDTRSVLHLGLTHFHNGDYDTAREWFGRRTEMGGAEEEIFVALHHLAAILANTGAPWPQVRGALMNAFEFRPRRAEPVYAIAAHYRSEQRFALGYPFAKLAAEIPFPQQDSLFVSADVYAWRATEEQLACAAGLGNYAEVFTLCRDLVSRPAVPEADRQRIAGNRDQVAPMMIDAALAYPDALVRRQLSDPGGPEVLVSLIAGPDLTRTETALNSFLNSCNDITLVGRFLVIDAGLSAADRVTLQKRYAFVEFTDAAPDTDMADDLAQREHIRTRVDARYWLHLGEGWRFFAPDNLITRLIAILAAEPDVAQVCINYTDATRLTGNCAPEDTVRRAPGTGRYLATNEKTTGPTMFDTTRLDQTGMQTASLDEVLCVATSRYISL
jgi:Glycosyl transferase family 2